MGSSLLAKPPRPLAEVTRWQGITTGNQLVPGQLAVGAHAAARDRTDGVPDLVLELGAGALERQVEAEIGVLAIPLQLPGSQLRERVLRRFCIKMGRQVTEFRYQTTCRAHAQFSKRQIQYGGKQFMLLLYFHHTPCTKKSA